MATEIGDADAGVVGNVNRCGRGVGGGGAGRGVIQGGVEEGGSCRRGGAGGVNAVRPGCWQGCR